jgi:uncharacterized protein YjbI with pentapeptide repeats
MNNVSFRDAVLEDVRILGGEFEHIDFRGSRLANCEFFGGGKVHALESIQLAFAAPDAVQDKGVFTIEDSDSVGISMARLEAKLGQAQLKEIKEYLTEENKKVGWLWRKDPNEWGRSWKKSDLTEAQQAHITEIEAKYEKQLEEGVVKLRRELSVRFDNPTLDPTYTANQTAERAAAIKVPLEATKKDLEEYQSYSRVKGNEPISFNDFVAKKYSKELEEVRFDNQNTMVVPVVELIGQDLSKMDLSGLDLRGINLSYCNMKDCKFNGAKLAGSCLEGCKLKGAQFEEANLMDCNLIGVIADKKTSFEKAVMIRTQLNASQLKGAKLDGAIGYLASFKGSDMERASLVEADLRRSDFTGVNLNYVDARYADMRRANLTGAIADNAKLMQADLTEAVANGFRAQGADLERAVLEGVQAQFADLKMAKLERVKAGGADFSHADLRELKAARADFEGAVLRQADASLAEFHQAKLSDVVAQAADFTGADMREIEAERIDISEAVVNYAKLQAANLKDAVMQDISAKKADFKKAILKKANLRRAALVGADFRGADLSEANVKGAVLMAADLEGANVTHMQIDPATILIDANLRGLIGDEETVKALQMQQKEQHALQKQWLSKSKYGHCAANEDGSNDRFKCQRLGAAVLSSAIAYGAAGAVTLSGPLAGIPAATLAALISDKALVATKDTYFGDLNYINNSLGDRLAEVGAIAMSMGVGAADKAIDGAAAGVACSLAGVLSGAAMTATGVGVAALGLKLSGGEKVPRWRKWAGRALAAVGAVTAALGFTSFGASLNTIAYTTAAGAALGAAWAGLDSAKRLYNYDEKTPEVGARPEQIYKESLVKAKGLLTKITPTRRKILLGLALAAIGAPVGLVAAQAFLVAAVGTMVAAGAGAGLFVGVKKGKTRASKIGYGLAYAAVGAATGFLITEVPLVFGIAKGIFATNTAITASAAGFSAGYLYDDKILPEPSQVVMSKPKQEASQDEALTKELQGPEQAKAKEAELEGPAQEPGKYVKKNPKKGRKAFKNKEKRSYSFVEELDKEPRGPRERSDSGSSGG